jgi:hypothetical protein
MSADRQAPTPQKTVRRISLPDKEAAAATAKTPARRRRYKEHSLTREPKPPPPRYFGPAN